MPVEEIDGLKIYKPTIRKEKPLPLDKSSLRYSEKLTQAMTEGGEIAVTLDDEVVMQRIAKDLYSSYLSGLRELYNNEARAGRQSKAMGASPLIEVTLDASEKQLTIHGIDSLGITEEVFLKVMRRLGVSGNLVGSEVGQFGFGFASYTTLSDLVTVLTWSRETQEQYAVMGKNGIKFNMLPKPSLEAYGTKLSLTYKKDIEPSQLIENLIQFAKFSRVKTELIMVNDIEVGKYSRNENWTAYANTGRYNLPQYEKTMDYIDAVVGVDEDLEEENSGKLLWRIDVVENNSDYEFAGTIYAIKNRWDKGSIQGARTHETVLLGTPIQSDISFDGFTAYVLNIKDERKYMPTADRDRMTDKAQKDVKKVVAEMIRNNMAKFNLKSINDYLKCKHKELYTDSKSFTWNDRTKTIIDTIQTTVYPEKSITNGKKLGDLIATEKYKHLIYMPKMVSKKIEEILTDMPNSLVFKIRQDDGNVGRVLANFRECGIIFGEEYLTDKRKLNKGKEAV